MPLLHHCHDGRGGNPSRNRVRVDRRQQLEPVEPWLEYQTLHGSLQCKLVDSLNSFMICRVVRFIIFPCIISHQVDEWPGNFRLRVDVFGGCVVRAGERAVVCVDISTSNAGAGRFDGVFVFGRETAFWTVSLLIFYFCNLGKVSESVHRLDDARHLYKALLRSDCPINFDITLEFGPRSMMIYLSTAEPISI